MKNPSAPPHTSHCAPQANAWRTRRDLPLSAAYRKLTRRLSSAAGTAFSLARTFVHFLALSRHGVEDLAYVAVVAVHHTQPSVVFPRLDEVDFGLVRSRITSTATRSLLLRDLASSAIAAR